MAWKEPGSDRDPWNNGSQGGGNGSGMPDFQKLLDKLRKFLKGSGGGSGHGPSRGLVALLVMTVIAIWLLSGFYTVDAQQRGVVLRLGAVARVVQPGLGWHVPWPVGKLRLVNVTKLRQASTQGTLITKDDDLVDVGLTVQFKVSSPQAYLYNVSNPDNTLAQAAKSALRSVVADYDIDAVLGNAQQEISQKTKQSLQKILNGYKTGLQVTNVSLKDVKPPKQVQAAFADAIKAGNDANKLNSKAQTYAQDRLPRARKQASAEIAAAHSHTDKAIADARGAKARFDALLKAYRKAPQVTRDRLYADTLKSIISNNRVVVVGAHKGKVAVSVNLAPATAASSKTVASPIPDKKGKASSGPSTGKGGNTDTSRSRSRGGSR